ncbi:MAG: tetratricopeptide repeat protein [Bradyrhizobium sp.]|nr:tetratricopeptide repeat protein [Bradyrhizobium sp.]
MNSGEGRAAAHGSDQTAKAHDRQTPAALHALGLQHMQAGCHLDAQLCCEQALAIDPLHVDSFHLMGLLSLQARQYDHAIAWIARANRQDPKGQHLISLGIALTQQGLPGEAFKAFDAAVSITPDDAETWLHHARTLESLQRPAEAVTSYGQVLKLNPSHADAAFRCAFLLRNLNRTEEALALLDLCDRLVPNDGAVHERRGLVLHELKRFEEALDASLRAYLQRPASPEICNNIGAALLKLRRYEEALPWLDRALARLPGSATVLISKAGVLARLLRLNEAIAVCAQAKAIDPGNADVAFLLSEFQLLSGDFEAGWVGREARWKSRVTSGYPELSQPMWLGDGPIEGKTILVFADEGLGDTIQFARYIPMLAARGARVLLWVVDPLASLLSGLSGVSRLLTKSDPLPAFDLHCPLCSLPLAFRTRLETIPPDGYLPRPAEARIQAWEDRLQTRFGPRSKPRVGLAWSGNPNHSDDQNRSVQLQKLLCLLDLDIAFVSLQKDPRADDRALLETTAIVDLTAHLNDFAETAALISCLDLVITVDTSVAHLASALGRPTWILLPYTPDWRWMLGRDDSPWYRSVRLFRQDEQRDYAPVIARVREALRARLSA